MVENNPHAFSSQDLFKRVDTQTTTSEYRNKQAIFAQNDKADAMFYVQNGNVKLTVASKNGKKAVIAIMRPGEFFGECCLTKRSLRTATATAIEPSTIVRMKGTSIAQIIHENPDFAKLFIAHLLRRMGRGEEEFVDQICNSSEKRLARILVMLADSGTQPNAKQPLMKVNQETLAEMVGTTRSRVSFFMNRFRKKGLINYNGSLKVNKALRDFLLQE